MGQCAVTALIVQDFFGGDLLRAAVGESSHYWNRTSDHGEIDLTRDQFGPGVQLPAGEVRDRAHVLSFPDTRRRYDLLLRRIQDALLDGRSLVDGSDMEGR